MFQESIANIEKYTDKYFSKTKQIIKANDEAIVIYAFFLRQDSLLAIQSALDFIHDYKLNYNYDIQVMTIYKEGDFVEKEKALFFLKGKFTQLVELETLLLQKIALPCICAWYAYNLCKNIPKTSFISMIARHCCSQEMVYLAEYGASVGSNLAKTEGAKGFIGCSTDQNAPLFQQKNGIGTMPHALVGYAGSTLNAAKLYHQEIQGNSITILVDYYAKELTDTIEVCQYFTKHYPKCAISIRLDTNGARYIEGLNDYTSNEVFLAHIKQQEISIRKFTPKEQSILYGKGVSGAAIIRLRAVLDNHNSKQVKIIASSGLNLLKCLLIGEFRIPVNVVGTGSYLPDSILNSFATADIIAYNDKFDVKKGREFLIQQFKQSIFNKVI